MRIVWPTITVDLAAGTVHRLGQTEQALTQREVELLRYLYGRCDQVVERAELLRDVWQMAPSVLSRATDNVVRRLRTKLEVDPAQPKLLLTVHGGGYRLVGPSPPVVLPPPQAPPTDAIVHGGRTVDLSRGVVVGPDGVSSLTARELDLLAALRSAGGASVDRDALQRGIWGSARGRALEHTVSRLRKKIEEDPANPALLVTTARGYRLDLPSAAPPLSPARPAPLPTERERRIGRDALVADVRAAFERGGRLVTLVGIGGIGKTRVALAVAQRWTGPAWWIGLDAGPEAPLTLLARAVGLSPQAADVPGAVAAALEASGSSLLVLDGAQAQDSDWVGALVDRTRRVAVLVTARAPLKLRSEAVLAVPPLPDDAAEALFVSQLARELGPAERALLPALVARLGGVPLALELAAARARASSLPHLLEQLTVEASRVLRSVAVDRPARQESMEAALRGSLEALSAEARLALRRLAVFVGAAPEGVASRALAGQGGWELQELADAGLIFADPAHRWRVPQVIRDAVAAPAGTPERGDDERRHFAAWAATRAELRLDLEAEHWQRLADALPDLELATRNALAAGALAEAAECVVAWARIVDQLGPWSAAPPLLEAAAAAMIDANDAARVYAAAANARFRTGPASEALALADRAMDAACQAADPTLADLIRPYRARIAAVLDRADVVERDLAACFEAEAPSARAWLVRGLWLRRRGQIEEACAALQHATVVAGRARDLRILAEAHAELGATLGTLASAEADRHFIVALRTAERIGDTWLTGLVQGHRNWALQLSDPRAGVQAELALAEWFGARGATTHQAWCLVGAVAKLLELSELERSSEVMETLELLELAPRMAAERARLRATLWYKRGQLDRALISLRGTLDEARLRQDPLTELVTAAQLAEILSETGQLEEAREHGLAAMQLAERWGSVLRQVEVALLLGQIARGAGSAEEARSLFERALALSAGSLPRLHERATAALRAL